MQMNYSKKGLTEIRDSTIEHCAELPGQDKCTLIDECYDDYLWVLDINSPKQIQEHYRELLSTLVKKFGH